MKLSTLQDRVVVITGASSGIGKLAAEEFLKQGAKVVMAARSLDAMEEHLMELNTDEAHALPVGVDVSDYEEVRALAQKAREHFGKIDVWVNNAAISLYGQLDELEPDDISRVVDVNLKGHMYGSKVALEIFKQQGFGNLVNVSSVVGKTPVPLQGVYVATKHGIVGFTHSMREELIHEGKKAKDIDISLVLPASMDTPFFQHAKHQEGVQPYPIPPVYDPRVSVNAIIRCAKNPVPEVVAGNAGKSMVFLGRLFPRMIEQYMGRTAVKQQQTDIPKNASNLYAPMRGTGKARGGIGTTGDHLIEAAVKHPLKFGIAIALPLALLSVFAVRRRAV